MQIELTATGGNVEARSSAGYEEARLPHKPL
jgi:hypothetical protein